jgi:2-polyprenyl-3-methyl-5-hydroxy-6-metoxy-1,4-benzoquinol methylase
MSDLRWKIAQYFEKKWWRWYLKPKDKAEYLDWKKSYWNKFITDNNIKLIPNSTILDAGCGPAGVFIVLENHTVVALDPLLNNYIAEGHLNKSIFNKVHFENDSIENWTNEIQFDYIFCINAINHVSNIENSLIQLNKWLKVGGTLFLSTDLHNKKWLKKIFQMIPGDILHPHQYDYFDYNQLFLKFNWKIFDEKKLNSESIFEYWLFTLKKQQFYDIA